jgi:hypothetical protein
MIVIGTTALAEHGMWIRQPEDVDVAATYKVPGKDTIVLPQKILALIPEINGYATPDAVYTIKCSHLGWDIKWKKHKKDVLTLKHKGCKIIPKLYEALVAHWKEVNGNKDFLDMYKTKEEFFDDAVPKVIEHDMLHKISTSPYKPIYMDLHENGQEVAIDKNKFDVLPLWKQIRMFQEEIAVIAVERWLINPMCKNKYHWIQAWDKALHKTMVALTKDWMTDFMIEHLSELSVPQYKLFKQFYIRGILIMNSKINADKIIDEILEASGDNWKEENSYKEDYFVEELESFGEFESIENLGGEGEESYAHFIFKWKGVYYKYIYSYSSYDGFDFNYAEMYIVTPKKKMVMVYE